MPFGTIKAYNSFQFSEHVYCGQTAAWFKMKRGMKLGLGPGHIVLDGDPAPLHQRCTVPQFSAHVCCGQQAGWIKMSLGREVGLSPSDIALDGEPASPPQWGTDPNFRPMPIVTKRSPISATAEHLSIHLLHIT